MSSVLGPLIPITAILGVFFMPVLALWIIMHYRAKRHGVTQTSADERAAVETLTRAAERMEERIRTLEQILDAEVPRWRQTLRDNDR